MRSPTTNTPEIARPIVDDSIIEAIEAMSAPVVVTHVVPDADAVGSMYAMARASAAVGLQPRVSLPDGCLSQRLDFLRDWAKMPVAGPEDFANADGFIVLDTAKEDRCNVGPDLKGTQWSAGRPVVNIDHHATNTRFGDVNWVAADVGSTCELVYYLLCAMGRPIDPIAASCLFAGIHTDTLGFSLPTTTASALWASAELVALGADVPELGERLCRSRRKSEFDLLRVVYANTKLLAEGRLAFSSASFDEIYRTGCKAADIDEQINVPRSLSGVQLAMLLTEGRVGKTRINFRGSGPVTVVELAEQFGGGGHSQAAGAVLDCNVQEAIDRVVPRALDHLKKFQP